MRWGGTPVRALISAAMVRERPIEAILSGPAASIVGARWLTGDAKMLEAFAGINRSAMAKDRDGNAVFLAKSAWDVNYQQERNPDIQFSATRER